jgi:hypothetical protein
MKQIILANFILIRTEMTIIKCNKKVHNAFDPAFSNSAFLLFLFSNCRQPICQSVTSEGSQNARRRTDLPTYYRVCDVFENRSKMSICTSVLLGRRRLILISEQSTVRENKPVNVT